MEHEYPFIMVDREDNRFTRNKVNFTSPYHLSVPFFKHPEGPSNPEISQTCVLEFGQRRVFLSPALDLDWDKIHKGRTFSPFPRKLETTLGSELSTLAPGNSWGGDVNHMVGPGCNVSKLSVFCLQKATHFEVQINEDFGYFSPKYLVPTKLH